MSLVNLKERFLRLSELVRDDLRPVILDIAVGLLDEFESHRISMGEIRTMLNHMSSRMAVAIASAIDDLWADESLALAKHQDQTRRELQEVRRSIEQLERHLIDLDQRIDHQYHAIAHAIDALQPANHHEEGLDG